MKPYAICIGKHYYHRDALGKSIMTGLTKEQAAICNRAEKKRVRNFLKKEFQKEYAEYLADQAIL